MNVMETINEHLFCVVTTYSSSFVGCSTRVLRMNIMNAIKISSAWFDYLGYAMFKKSTRRKGRHEGTEEERKKENGRTKLVEF